MITVFVAGLVCGIILIAVTMVLFMPQMGKLFFVSNRSRLPFSETVDQIRTRCEQDENWVIQDEKDYNQAYLKRKQGELPHRLVEFKLGNPDHSFRVNYAFPEVATFMPAAIAIVEYEPNNVVIYRKNTGFMGRMFKEPVRSIMGAEVPQQLDKILDGIVEK